MKKRYITAAISVFAALSMCLCAVSQQKQQKLAEKLIRLHVVANSDTQEDQRVKLLVRDAVLCAAADALEGEHDPEAALRKNLSAIERAANETLASLGSGDTAKVSFKRELFPTREYETFRLPAGVYRSLRVTIGAGEGHNWWCVVFPALCLPANAEDFETVCEAAGFTEEEISVLTEESGEIEVEFKTLELLGKLKKNLWERSQLPKV